MAKGSVEARGRVTVWKQTTSRNGAAVLAYAAWASHGSGYPETAILGVVAGELPLWAWATNNTTAEDLPFWLVCRGWAKRIVRTPGTLELPDADWAADLDRLVDLKRPCYGHERIGTGRLTLEDPELMARAQGLLEAPLLAV